MFSAVSSYNGWSVGDVAETEEGVATIQTILVNDRDMDPMPHSVRVRVTYDNGATAFVRASDLREACMAAVGDDEDDDGGWGCGDDPDVDD